MKTIFATICFLAIAITVFAQGPACKWSPPNFDAINLDNFHLTQVTANCNGGIVGCSARVKSYLWVYDPLSQTWVLYGDNPRTNRDIFKNCGSSLTSFDVIYNQELPSFTYCCLELEFWSKNGQTYVYIGSGYNYFTTP